MLWAGESYSMWHFLDQKPVHQGGSVYTFPENAFLASYEARRSPCYIRGS